MPLQIRRGTDQERQAMTERLAPGEPLWVDNQKLYIGDGTTASASLAPVTGFTAEEARDAVAPMFTGGTHTGIGFSYNDTLDQINATVDLTSYVGPLNATTLTANSIVAGAIKGTIVADDSTILVDGVDGVLRGQLIGTHTGNVTGNVVGNLTGNVTGNVLGNVTGDLIGSVFGDDSTAIINGVNNTVVGDVDNSTVSTDTLNAGLVVIDSNLTTGGLAIRTQGDTQNDNFDLFNIISANSSSNSNFATFSKARGTIANPTALQTDDGIFSLLFIGHATNDFEVAGAIEVSVDGSVGSGYTPGKLALATSDTAGNVLSRLVIDSKGTSAFNGMVQLASYEDDTEANAVVGGSPVNGMMYYDATINKVKAYQNGAWVALT